jgi:hypothetical protein
MQLSVPLTAGRRLCHSGDLYKLSRVIIQIKNLNFAFDAVAAPLAINPL